MSGIHKKSVAFKVATQMTEEFDDIRGMTLKELSERYKLDTSSCHGIRVGIFAQRIYWDKRQQRSKKVKTPTGIQQQKESKCS